MSNLFLSRNQRELVKFMKPYVLHSQSKKKATRSRRFDSDADFLDGPIMNPAEEELLDFRPDENDIDGKLYKCIVELDGEALNDKDENDGSDSTSEDEDYRVGGRRGFNTNIDDYLKEFGSVA